MTAVDTHIGKRIRRRRKLMGQTQANVASLCGVSFQQFAKWEAGVNRLNAEQLWKVSKALLIPVSYLFEGLEALQEAA